MTNTLRSVYQDHQGKVSDKWSLYLDVYDRIFAPWRERPLTMVEVGVQNGGSLDIWTRYFPNAMAFIGCDIDPRCATLRYQDPRVSVVVGNINEEDTAQAIFSRAGSWDIFIDDGSHTSQDIILTFANYFRYLKPGGLYIIEDLHCGYWPAYGGGIAAAGSSMHFLKRIADMINFEHWQGQQSAQAWMADYFPADNLPDYGLFADIFGVSFYNSMCVIEKCSTGQSPLLGDRIIVGSDAQVSPQALQQRSSAAGR